VRKTIRAAAPKATEAASERLLYTTTLSTATRMTASRSAEVTTTDLRFSLAHSRPWLYENAPTGKAGDVHARSFWSDAVFLFSFSPEQRK